MKATHDHSSTGPAHTCGINACPACEAARAKADIERNVNKAEKAEARQLRDALRVPHHISRLFTA